MKYANVNTHTCICFFSKQGASGVPGGPGLPGPSGPKVGAVIQFLSFTNQFMTRGVYIFG